MPHPTFQTNEFVDSVESVESLMESTTNLITDYIHLLQKENQELRTDKENLQAEVKRLQEALNKI